MLLPYSLKNSLNLFNDIFSSSLFPLKVNPLKFVCFCKNWFKLFKLWIYIAFNWFWLSGNSLKLESVSDCFNIFALFLLWWYLLKKNFNSSGVKLLMFEFKFFMRNFADALYIFGFDKLLLFIFDIFWKNY